MFWKTWSRSVNGAWPIQWPPSPPIWAGAIVLRPAIRLAIVWQPMPASAMLPSGRRVDRLCGQPAQKNSVRAWVARVGLAVGSGATRPRTRVRSSSPRCGSSQSASTRATRPTANSPPSGSWRRPSAPTLPSTRGAAPPSRSNRISLSCGSTTARFSSTTSSSCNGRAKAVIPSGSSGQVIATL